jgi:cytoskeleton protein RodZ
MVGSTAGRAVADEVAPGRALRAAREARGLSIEDVSRTTKIGRPTLTALEESNVDKLPATIFTRGFLKAYASEVGLDPDETADRYLAQVAPKTRATDGADARLKGALPADRTELRAHDDYKSRFLAEGQVGRLGWLVTAVAVVGLVAYIWSFNLRSSEDAPEATLATETASDVAPATADAARGVDAAPAVGAIETPIGPLRLQLKPHGPCWLAVAADGRPLFARLLRAGEEHTIEANNEVVLRVGDPAALVFTINGHEGRPLGRAEEPVDVRITKDNFREFLSL